MALPIQTAEFVDSSEIFKGKPLALQAFTDSDPECSWGNNNRTLVTVDFLAKALTYAAEQSLEGYDDDDIEAEVQKQIGEVQEVLKGLPPLLYVDLEN